MSLKSFFTAYFDSLADKETRFIFKNELKTKLFKQKFQNQYKGKTNFLAVVLQSDPLRPSGTGSKSTQQGEYILARVRPIDIHDFILPEPCDATHSNEEIIELVNLHPQAVSLKKYPTNSFSVGSVVRCIFFDQGPDTQGRTRGLRIEDAVDDAPRGYHNYDCLKSTNTGKRPAKLSKTKPTKQKPKKPIDATACRPKSQGGTTKEQMLAAYKKAGKKKYQMKNISALADKIIKLCNDNGISDPGWLINAIEAESSWSTRAQNKDTQASGLIQLMPYHLNRYLGNAPPTFTSWPDLKERYPGVGRTTQLDNVWKEYIEENHGSFDNVTNRRSSGYLDAADDFINYSASKQWPYIKRYLAPKFKKYKDKEWTQTDVMMTIFFPAALFKGEDWSFEEYYINKYGKKRGKRKFKYMSSINANMKTAGDYRRVLCKYRYGEKKGEEKCALPQRFCDE